MTEPRRLLNLPGYDNAPDVYETADDDASTTLTQQTSPRSPPEPSETSDEEGEEFETGGVSRRRLYPERARSRFAAQGRTVETEGVDLSDRIDGRRRGYRVRKRREGDEEGDGEEEGLEARVARLRREIEEVKAMAEEDGQADGGAEEGEEEVEGLRSLLDGVEVPEGGRAKRRVPASSGTPASWPEADGEGDGEEQTLSRDAQFDSRLSALEQTLGISALDTPGGEAVAAPLLPSLTLLDQQLAALSTAISIAQLEAASGRLQKLRKEADMLSSRPTAEGESEEPSYPQLTQDDTTKLQSLYTLLPTLSSLSPTVPALLTRLRSLRTLHAGAATAASELDHLEKRQSEMGAELKAWREGLEKVERAVLEASEANGRNGKVVEGWVRELEGRMKGLGR